MKVYFFRQMQTELIKQCQEVKQNWTGQETWYLFLCNF